MDSVKNSIIKEIENLTDEITATSSYLLNNPETAFKEYKASAYLSNVLEEHGFEVKKYSGELETAFLAQPKGMKAVRPVIALLAEYDALPKIGHGCGHNLIAAASLGAAVALKNVKGEHSNGFVVVGTPAEEGGGGKVKLIEKGVFNDIDAAMMFHPAQTNIPGRGMLGRIKFSIEFHGKTAHASNSPDKGINALDALIQTFNNINSLRQTMLPQGRIHGIITHGGEAPNIIPDYAAGLFYVRGNTIAYRDKIFDKVVSCAEAAAMAVGAKMKIKIDGPKIDPFKLNHCLQDMFKENMINLGIKIDKDNGRRGSSDIGNLSHFIPTIHPYLAITNDDIASHSVEFRDATDKELGRSTLIAAAKLLALTSYDYLSSPDLQKCVAEEFKR